jgi:hypothetical protein
LIDKGQGTGRGLGEFHHADGTLRVNGTEGRLTSEKETADEIRVCESGRGERGIEQGESASSLVREGEALVKERERELGGGGSSR